MQAVSIHGGVNPTRVDLRLGPHLVKLLIYSWYITLEGKGRTKDDFRIQTTRAHGGLLMDEHGRVTVGLGWRVEDELFVGFDGWAKRFHGKSSSVHTRRVFIDEVTSSGLEVGGMLHDPRCGFDRAHVAGFVKWAHALGERKTAGLVPVRSTRLDPKHMVITGLIHASQASARLRVKDRIIVFNKRKQIADSGIWQIRELTTVEEKTAKGRSRWLIDFDCRLVGTVDDLSQDIIDDLL